MTHDGSARFVPLDIFVAVDEPGADALLGAADDVLIPQGGDLMIYGDGGAGKTTLGIDLAFHLAAGDDWCGITVTRAVAVGIVENEGPRPLFRQKLRRKRESWAGSAIGDRLHVFEQPWAQFTFADPTHRAWLAASIVELELDVVFIGPLTRVGMNEAGTLQETRDFSALLADVRALAARPITFSLTHHESKSGAVSGAWEGAGDTLLHVQAQGHGRTRLYVQKARWASEWHGKSLQLLWAPGDGFTVGDAPENGADTIADAIIAAVRAAGGQSWNTIEKAVPGNAERKRAIRDGLLEGGRLLDANAGRNVKTMLLWDADDPLRPMRLDADAPADAPGETAELRPASPLKGTQTLDADADAADEARREALWDALTSGEPRARAHNPSLGEVQSA